MGRVITVEDWAEIRRLYLAERMPIKAIAKKLGLARNTVRHAVRFGAAAAVRASGVGIHCG
jgi:DNA-binding transcriptional regulator LsrR (DeoR family)